MFEYIQSSIGDLEREMQRIEKATQRKARRRCSDRLGSHLGTDQAARSLKHVGHATRAGTSKDARSVATEAVTKAYYFSKRPFVQINASLVIASINGAGGLPDTRRRETPENLGF
ncbi:hypothetical protein DFH08DRAFT_799806 [Mycena albidolilacea]|uniref:Uncharacterized protein n=1 Tax=Mycena albidolilacea TaxID=1033008 RepID=A0AAD7AM76_9AGAR|nr:hypothetical protein DFH08DRAFT_799806 [Mycena albidolilacea]